MTNSTLKSFCNSRTMFMYMAAIRARNTKPEISVRKFLFRHGLRFRLHSKALPGKPDIVLPGRRLAIFVHGCFWHGCKRCVDGRRRVKSNSDYWLDKVRSNKARDRRHEKALSDVGWRTLTIWECEVENPKQLNLLLSKIQQLEPVLPSRPNSEKRSI
jgi:DNA mismatch endonuclease (patch repair protein)